MKADMILQEANMNICMNCIAYLLRTQPTDGEKAENTPYKRVRTDLMKKLDIFHWAWEAPLDGIRIRYIPDNDGEPFTGLHGFPTAYLF